MTNLAFDWLLYVCTNNQQFPKTSLILICFPHFRKSKKEARHFDEFTKHWQNIRIFHECKVLIEKVPRVTVLRAL